MTNFTCHVPVPVRSAQLQIEQTFAADLPPEEKQELVRTILSHLYQTAQRHEREWLKLHLDYTRP